MVSLLIDMGNTRLKWATSDDSDWVSGTAIQNELISYNVLSQCWQTLKRPEQIAISCVNTTNYPMVVGVVQALWPGGIILRAQAEANWFDIKNAYVEPRKLGVDRWLAMIASYHKYHQALCIVGCGTAITVDVVDQSGQHLGGFICPGLRLMRKSLATGTENLEFIDQEYPLGMAKFTEAAIYNGTLLAASGLINSALKQHSFKLQLILTGGDAERIAAHVDHPALIEPELVLRGLHLLLKHPGASKNSNNLLG